MLCRRFATSVTSRWFSSFAPIDAVPLQTCFEALSQTFVVEAFAAETTGGAELDNGPRWHFQSAGTQTQRGLRRALESLPTRQTTTRFRRAFAVSPRCFPGWTGSPSSAVLASNLNRHDEDSLLPTVLFALVIAGGCFYVLDQAYL